MAPCARRRAAASRCRLPTRSRRHTPKASCTATSSRPTSCWWPAAAPLARGCTRSCSTSGSPASSACLPPRRPACRRADVSGSSRTGVIAGTLRYMAPEQMRGEDADPRSDIFSLGCVMYEMVSGRAPFAGDSVRDVMSAILGPDAPALTFAESRSGTAGADVSRRFAAAVRRCLEKAPDRRFESSQRPEGRAAGDRLGRGGGPDAIVEPTMDGCRRGHGCRGDGRGRLLSPARRPTGVSGGRADEGRDADRRGTVTSSFRRCRRTARRSHSPGMASVRTTSTST